MIRGFIVFIGLVLSCANLQAADENTYVLSTGDTINILVYEEADLSFDVKIDETGLFAYPYLDNLYLLGKTTEQLENEIADGLRGRVLINPNVAISIVEYRTFSIGGEVSSPGNYPYEPGINVAKAINLAGGLTEWASNSRYTLEREGLEGKKKNLGLDEPLRPGDIVTILPRRF